MTGGFEESDVPEWSLDATKTGLVNVGNPKFLPVCFYGLQASGLQINFFDPQERKVRQVAEHRLKPAMLREKPANTRVEKFVRVKCEHRDVL